MRPLAPPAVALVLSLLSGTLRAQQCPDGSQACRSTPRPPAPNSIAVFPFSSRSPDTTDAYLAEGMTDEVGNQLTKLSRVQVKAHGLVAAAWQKNRDLAAAARSLGVAWFLDGSVRHGSGQLLINVALVRVTTGEQVWASRFQRRDADLFGAQAEVAESVAVMVGGRLSSGERAVLTKRPTRNDEAFRLYTLGNSLLGRRTSADLRRAAASYAEAARLDPGFTAAWARLGIVRAIQVSSNVYEPTVYRDSLLAAGHAAASRALKLDSLSADALQAAGNLALDDGDLWIAQRYLELSLAHDSVNAEAWHIYGNMYGYLVGASLGLPRRAEPLLRRAVALDPTLRNSWRWLGSVLRVEGQLAESEAVLDTALSFGPFVGAYLDRAATRFYRGNVRGALADLDDLARMDSVDRAPVRVLYAIRLGDSTAARARLAHLIEQARGLDPANVSNIEMSRLSAELGLKEDALRHLEALANQPFAGDPRCAPNTLCSKSLRTWRTLQDPIFNSLHSDPRFERLVAETMPKVPWLPATEQGR